jgi:O-antigen/teichoic acid export membrane protein
MNSQIFERLGNLALRGLSMGSKFVLVIFLAKYLSVPDIGLYGLIVVTVSFGVTLIGGEFYTYSQRELLSLDKSLWCNVLKNQVVAYFLLYLIVLPLQYLIFYNGWLPSVLIPIYILLLISEHIAQEINRVLITMQKQLVASCVLFFRLGAWVWVVIPLFLYNESFRTLDVILWAWLIGTVLSIVIGSYFIFEELPEVAISKVDTVWIKNGYVIAFKFFCATLCYRAIMTVDRYLIEYVGGGDILAVYVVYISIAMAINSVLVPTVFSFIYPKLISNYKKGNYAEYSRNLKELIKSVLFIGGGVAILIGFFAPLIFEWTDKIILLENTYILWLLLIMSFLYSASMIPHYVLYAKGLDNKILYSHMVGLLVFSIGCLVSIQFWKVDFILYSLIGSMLSILISKYWFSSRNELEE